MSLADRCEYSSRKWCSVTQDVLEAGPVGRLDDLEVLHEDVVLGVGVDLAPEIGYHDLWMKRPNSMVTRPLIDWRSRSRPPSYAGRP